MKIEWDDREFKKWVKDLEKNLPKELHFDPDQSDSQNVASLRQQFKKAGGHTPDNKELRDILSNLKKSDS